ncbi:VanZ family protein [Vibrio bivalvicida]|uniref:VanZ-like domain-containing protein n=1 Tax=Vibrio bivalvicida TaxID=1276888 RepID=A0A177XXT4_9VIBR|nr:hypothetical protein [Vibrio bivalvicida]OAJ93391.1 hypothetical protein APB76_15635 [Vibrio bivalvicida]
MYLVEQLFSKRLIVLFSLMAMGGGASMAKSFDFHGDAIRALESTLGGAWVLHATVATTLGFIAAWSTPVSYYHYHRLILSPWVLGLLVMVSLDELLQMFNPLREFAVLDLTINLFCVTLGALLYVNFLKLKFPLGSKAV